MLPRDLRMSTQFHRIFRISFRIRIAKKSAFQVRWGTLFGCDQSRIQSAWTTHRQVQCADSRTNHRCSSTASAGMDCIPGDWACSSSPGYTGQGYSGQVESGSQSQRQRQDRDCSGSRGGKDAKFGLVISNGTKRYKALHNYIVPGCSWYKIHCFGIQAINTQMTVFLEHQEPPAPLVTFTVNYEHESWILNAWQDGTLMSSANLPDSEPLVLHAMGWDALRKC